MRQGTFLVASALVISAAGCNPASPDRTITTSADTNIIETKKITWPTKADNRAFASLGDPKFASSQLERSVVPVLAPTKITLERPTLIVGPEYYALTGRLSGATIAISGKRAAHVYDGVVPVAGNRRVRGVRGFVSENERIQTASWMENGAAYSVDVECFDANDERCASDAFVVDVVEQLGFAGGGER